MIIWRRNKIIWNGQSIIWSFSTSQSRWIGVRILELIVEKQGILQNPYQVLFLSLIKTKVLSLFFFRWEFNRLFWKRHWTSNTDWVVTFFYLRAREKNILHKITNYIVRLPNFLISTYYSLSVFLILISNKIVRMIYIFFLPAILKNMFQT